MEEMPKNYDPSTNEPAILQKWLDGGYYKRREGVGDCTVTIPPPNVTGKLHMGHATDDSIQDAIIRMARMRGKSTRWVLGTDHAGIATQTKVDKKLKSEGISRLEIGRDKFVDACWDWTHEYGGIIVEQIKRMGCSVDFDNERFTMDEDYAQAVRKVFCDWYHDGLIYRGKRIVNWCPNCTTAISDDEAEYKDEKGHLWHLRYPLTEPVNGQDYIVVATTRPETMLGDTGVAVSPKDPEKAAFVGKTVKLPIVDREIPIFEDWHVDANFGSGFVKVTPAHDPNDYAMGQAHDLPQINIFDEHAVVVEGYGEFTGMNRDECREAVIKWFEEHDLLDHVEDHDHSVMHCYRCDAALEPWLSEQWFVAVDKLKGPALDAVNSGKVTFHPARWTQTYTTWMENLKDWCISRQLWWGHRIPVWYCDDCGAMTVSREDPTCCCKCGSAHIKQDEDVLDTWFSSALWPFSTLGWPDNTEDLKYFYPTNLLVTGYDIITFWVSRMITMGLEEMQVPPFQTVLIHGLVRDELGRKMSKSLGNGVDPLEVIDQYGADALRFSLVMGVSAGNDTRYIPARVESARNFANKIWNASRFVLMNVTEKAPLDTEHLTAADQWILSRFQDATRAISSNMEEGEFGLAADRIYDFAWSEFCDWYIELAKSRLNGDDPAAKKAVQGVLLYVLEGLLKLLHPFMPFLTEQVYKFLPGSEGFLMLKSWPEVKPELDFPDEEAKMEGVMEVIRTIRNLRAEMNVAAGKRTHLMLLPADGWAETLAHAGQYFQRLAGASETAIIESSAAVTEKTVSAVTKACTLYIPLGDLVDFEKEIARLSKELDNLHKEIARAEGKLNNPGFVSKAPAALVEQEKGKLALNQQKAEQVEKRIAELKESM